MAISGFLVVRDGIAHGYPFLEAIQSALPICDEFLIGDGQSSDGTWDALLALRDAYPQRVRLFREPWPGADIAALVAATNQLRQHCRFDYCLNLQANEVLHEASCAELAALPELYPRTEMFRLPFLNLMGRSLAWFVDFRRRLFRNRPYIAAVGDAFDVGYRFAALWRRPRRLLSYVRHRAGERTVYLRKPVYRYRALFPDDYLTKLGTRQRLIGAAQSPELAYARDVWRRMDQAIATPDVFWNEMRPYFDDVLWRAPDIDAQRFLPRRCLRDADTDGPSLMQPLFSAWRYPVADSVARLPRTAAAEMAGEDL